MSRKNWIEELLAKLLKRLFPNGNPQRVPVPVRVRIKKLRSWFFLLILFQLTALAHAQDARDVVILHTNDFHSRFAQAKPLIETIRNLRRQYPHSILLDAGDAFEGDVSRVRETRGMAVVEFMNEAGYDGMTLGDNAFEALSISDVRKCIQSFNFPVLSSNLLDERDANPFALPYWVYTINRITLGVIGVFDEDEHAGVKIVNPIAVARHYIDLLKNKVDCVILLTHQGLKKDREMAEKIPGIDVIIGGSTQVALESPILIGTTIITQAGEYGKYVGVLQLKVNTSLNRVEAFTGELVPAK